MIDTTSPEFFAAQRFWNLIGHPDEYLNEVAGWSKSMRDCIGESEFDHATFLDFLRWATKVNSYSAEYLRLANDPMASLKKNLPKLLKRYKAFQAAVEAKAERDAAFSKKKPDPKCKCGRPKPCEIHDYKAEQDESRA